MRRLTVLVLAVAAMLGVARADTTYREETIYEWNRLALDVVVVPPGHGQIYHDGGLLPAGAADLNPIANSYVRAVEAAVRSWSGAAARFGAPWLATGLRLRTYVAGRDQLPAEPEIVVATAETMGPILGTSMPVQPCVAVVSKLFHVSFTEADMTNIATHEIGHCLGLEHVDGPEPRGDVMQAVYQYPDGLRSTPVVCPSTLNVRGLELVFAKAAGQGGGGGTAAVAAGSYRRAC